MSARSRLLALLVVVLPAVVSSQPGGPLAFHGTPVAPLGGATLVISPVTGRLVVGNIGPGGLDGVELNTGPAQGVKIELPSSPAAPTGAEKVARIQSDDPIITPSIQWVHGPVGVDIFVDFSSTGADGHIIEICNDGMPVAQTFIPMGDVVSCNQVPIALDVDMHAIPAIGVSPLVTGFEPAPMLMLTMPGPALFSRAAGPIATGNELRAYPSNPLAAANHMENLAILFDVPAVQAPDTVEIEDAAQLIEGRLHRGTMFGLIEKDFEGNVTFSVPAGLTGGIEMEAKASDTAQSITQNLKFGNAGDTDVFYAMGQLTDGIRGTNDFVSGSCDGSSWALAPDFSSSGSPSVSVQLFDAAGLPLGPPSPVVGEIVVGTNVYPTRTEASRKNGYVIAYDYMDAVPVTISAGTFLANRIEMFGQGDVPALMTQTGRLFSSSSDFTIEIAGESNGVLAPGGEFYLDSGFAGGFARNYDPIGCVEAVDVNPADGDPFVFEPVVQEDQFGVAWVPGPSPSTQPGQSDWDFVSRLAGETGAIARMGIKMVPEGGGVKLYSLTRQTPKTDFGDRLKAGTQTVAEFVHSDETVPFAILPAWPAAIGYQVLHYPDKTWSMWINLGQMMDVAIPDPPAGMSATQVVSADFIEVVFLDTPIASPVAESKLVVRGYTKSHRLFYGTKSKAVSVGRAPSRDGLSLRAPYPNPFNPSTTLSFDIPTAGDVSIRVYTVRGEYVATLHSGWMGPGPHAVSWDGVNHRGQRAASGVYLAELRAPGGTRHVKLNLLK
ncbi:MAG TPA: FlgD immunoglobulin-like domain containing protein [Candidatus Krumholzibacteria bacterium]|nr:FlgD immunoglobulin-like domain containing protein [Candidatus Krumholzibacteria bacterium]